MTLAASAKVPSSSDSPVKPLIAVTLGDPAGIGAEVIVKALHDPEIRSLGRFVVFGIHEVLYRAAASAGLRPFWFHAPRSDGVRCDSGVVVVDAEEFAAMDWTVARPSIDGGRASLQFFDAAIEAARNATVDAIVTGPIHKVSWRMAGSRHPGHTERISEAFGVKRSTMMFAADDLRVALASTHVGLFELRNTFTIGLVYQPIDLLHTALRDWFGVERPRIAVAGLNPHAGEEGAFGDEERRVIEPAIHIAVSHGIQTEGPFPADTLFTQQRRRRYDGIVAMYHDQGLIPVKMLAFDRAVNVTLGLPIIRTSVDHGTAFDIAGSNQANAGSMKAALRLACQFASIAGRRDGSSASASTAV